MLRWEGQGCKRGTVVGGCEAGRGGTRGVVVVHYPALHNAKMHVRKLMHPWCALGCCFGTEYCSGTERMLARLLCAWVPLLFGMDVCSAAVFMAGCKVCFQGWPFLVVQFVARQVSASGVAHRMHGRCMATMLGVFARHCRGFLPLDCTVFQWLQASTAWHSSRTCCFAVSWWCALFVILGCGCTQTLATRTAQLLVNVFLAVVVCCGSASLAGACRVWIMFL